MNGVIGIQIYMYTFLLQSIYLLHAKPYIRRRMRLIEVSNEFAGLLASYVFIIIANV